VVVILLGVSKNNGLSEFSSILYFKLSVCARVSPQQIKMKNKRYIILINNFIQLKLIKLSTLA
jgi:hypothetical protein